MNRFALIADHPGPDDKGLLEAFAWLVAEAGENEAVGAVFVARLDGVESLGRVLGSEAPDQLNRAKAIQIGDAEIRLITKCSRPSYFPHPILIPWASLEMISEAEAMHPSSVGVTGWNPNELDSWVTAHGVVDTRSGEPIAEQTKLDPALVGAVRSVTFGISDDVLHPSDKEHAIREDRESRSSRTRTPRSDPDEETIRKVKRLHVGRQRSGRVKGRRRQWRRAHPD